MVIILNNRVACVRIEAVNSCFLGFVLFFPQTSSSAQSSLKCFGVHLLLALAHLSTNQGCSVAVAVHVQLSVEPGCGETCSSRAVLQLGCCSPRQTAVLCSVISETFSAVLLATYKSILAYFWSKIRMLIVDAQLLSYCSSLFFGRFMWPQGWCFLSAIFNYFPVLHVRHLK